MQSVDWPHQAERSEGSGFSRFVRVAACAQHQRTYCLQLRLDNPLTLGAHSGMPPPLSFKPLAGGCGRTVLPVMTMLSLHAVQVMPRGIKIYLHRLVLCVADSYSPAS